jgi:hypothetical protein
MSATATATAKPAKAKKETTKVTKEKPVLVSFLKVAPATSLNPDGLLLTADVRGIGFDDSKHERITRADFANESLWITYRVADMRARAAEMLVRADSLEKEAAATTKFADPKVRAAVKRMKKLAESYAAHYAALKEAGVDISELIPPA